MDCESQLPGLIYDCLALLFLFYESLMVDGFVDCLLNCLQLLSRRVKYNKFFCFALVVERNLDRRLKTKTFRAYNPPHLFESRH